jgi:hypothetical protein
VQTSPSTYAETLSVPLRWWAIVTMFHASALLALLVAGLGAAAYLVMAAVVGVTVAVLLSYGAAGIEVTEDELVAGRARIPLRLLARPEALDAEATRDRIGPSADARAYLLVRPYIARSVVVDVVDADDPAPYWLVSSRHPRRLAAAIAARVTGGGPAEQHLRGVSTDPDRAD